MANVHSSMGHIHLSYTTLPATFASVQPNSPPKEVYRVMHKRYIGTNQSSIPVPVQFGM